MLNSTPVRLTSAIQVHFQDKFFSAWSPSDEEEKDENVKIVFLIPVRA